jgi:hypothetical protein
MLTLEVSKAEEAAKRNLFMRVAPRPTNIELLSQSKELCQEIITHYENEKLLAELLDLHSQLVDYHKYRKEIL